MSEAFDYLRKLAENPQDPAINIVAKHTSAIFADLATDDDMTDKTAMIVIFSIYQSLLATLCRHRGENWDPEDVRILLTQMQHCHQYISSRVSKNVSNILAGKGITK